MLWLVLGTALMLAAYGVWQIILIRRASSDHAAVWQLAEMMPDLALRSFRHHPGCIVDQPYRFGFVGPFYLGNPDGLGRRHVVYIDRGQMDDVMEQIRFDLSLALSARRIDLA
jgi:hypothetical protein